MQTNYYSLSSIENNRFVKILQLFFGVVTIAVAIFWIIYNTHSLKTDGKLWITIIFLVGFGFYMIWSGLGRTTRFIEIGPDNIRLKKNAILPAREIKTFDIDRIELFPLNTIFFLKSGKKIILRFGTDYPDIIEDIKVALITFADLKIIRLDLMNEHI